MKQVHYCIMCLETELKMFHMNDKMIKIYKELLPIHIKPAVKPVFACYECAYLLHKYEKFKAKCCRAYNIICNLNSADSFEVTKENLRGIDRKQNNLSSLLSVCTTSDYFHIKQRSKCNSTHNQFLDNTVKTELILINLDKHKEDTYHTERLFQTPPIDPITVDNNLGSKSKSSPEVVSLEYDIEDDNHSLDNSDTGNTNELTLSEVVINESAMKVLDLETTKAASNKNDVVSQKKFETTCFDCNSNRESAKLNKRPFGGNCLTSEGKVSIATKSGCGITNIKNEHNKEKKRRKTGTEELNGMDMKVIDDVHLKYLSKNESQRNSRKNVKVKDSNIKEDRFSIDSSIFKEYMTIIQLSQADATSELLLRKESKNYKINSHKCDLCYRGFISKATYQTHMKKHSLEYGTLKCDICQLSFTEPRYLTNHRIVCHTRKFLCKICTYVCFGANQARAHIRSHKGKKYTCKECGEIFRFPNSLSTHMRMRHSIEMVCDLCGSTFASTKGLDYHKRLIHRKEKNELLGPQCAECDVHFASELAWKRHLVLCSRHQVSNGCGVCGDVFADARSLRSHLREHGPLPTTWNLRLRKKASAASSTCATPQPCSHCDKELCNKKEYKIHMASEHPQLDAEEIQGGFVKAPQIKWVCEVCGKMFKHYSLFASHQRKHTGERPYDCAECGKRFKRADAARAHRAHHTGLYAFRCHVCERPYADRGKLNRHVKGHLGIRPYKCAYCDKSFQYQCVVNAHTKYVHCKEPYPKRDRKKKADLKANLK